MSSADRTLLSYAVETTYGVSPTGTYKDLRFTSESLAGAVEEVRSAEIRADRQVADVMRVGLGAAGDVNFELSATTYDDWLMYLLGASAWSSAITVVGNTTIAAQASGDQIVGTGDPFVNINLGQWIRVTGFTNASNNGVFKVTDKPNDNTLVLGNAFIVDEAAGNAITVRMGAQIVNGTTIKSMTVQRKLEDIGRYFSYPGCGVDTLRLSGALRQLITGTFGLIGIKENHSNADLASGHTAVGTGKLFSPIQTHSGVPVDLSSLADNPGAFEMVEFDLNINANLRQRERIGALGSISQGVGKVDCTGSFRAYYDSLALYSYVINYSTVNVAMVLEGDANAALEDNPVYVFEFPACKLTPADGVVVPGENQDVMASVNFSAFRHPTEGITARITRIDAGAA